MKLSKWRDFPQKVKQFLKHLLGPFEIKNETILLKEHKIEKKAKKAKTSPKTKSINGGNQNISPQTQPPKLDFNPENTVGSRLLQRIKGSGNP